MRHSAWLALLALILTGLAGPLVLQPVAAQAKTDVVGEIVIKEGLVLPALGRRGRTPIPRDPLDLALSKGQWAKPEAGAKLQRFDGQESTWEKTTAKDDGWFENRAIAGGGLLATTVTVPDARIMILDASGHEMVYVNGQPRGGDVYGHGYVRLPVDLRPGDNEFLFQGQRGPRIRAKLMTPKAPIYLETSDVTQPDLVVGEALDSQAALLVVNATKDRLDDLVLNANLADGTMVATTVPSIAPLSLRKVGFQIKATAPTTPGKVDVEVRLARKSSDKPLDSATLKLDVRKPEETRRVTFVSNIDGTVQYFAMVPRKVDASKPPTTKPGLVLTLHGAGVEAYGQAVCYQPKEWGIVVAPTNRRSFGFDWEDWGRLDALEVLEIARKRWDTDPRHTYLTGHSMGGHGTWHVGVLYPDKFAAIGPSAGWISTFNMADVRRQGELLPVQEIILRTMLPGDTLAMKNNYKPMGVYVLHGAVDDNVSVQFARTMKEQLTPFHQDFRYDEREGKGHWWGNECMDWPPMLDFLAQHVLPERKDVHAIEFTTPSPSVSAQCHWARIEGQIHQCQLSTIQLKCDPAAATISGTTDNVSRLALDLNHCKSDKAQLELDGQKLTDVPVPPAGQPLRLARAKDQWKMTEPLPPGWKNAQRYGTFRDAWRNRVHLVYGTKGNAEENAWAFAKARFDAERFWYAANAGLDVIPDTAFDPKADVDRSVVLYGNADTNSAWLPLLSQSPVQVKRRELTIDGRVEKADDLACLFVRPRPASDLALVAAVSGTGVGGMKLTTRLSFFVSGVNYPDFTLFDGQALRDGTSAVRGAGFFGPDWSVERGEFAWRADPK